VIAGEVVALDAESGPFWPCKDLSPLSVAVAQSGEYARDAENSAYAG